MNQSVKIVCGLIFFVGIALISTGALAQNPVCVYCGTPLPNGIHAYGCKYYVATKSAKAASTNLNDMVAGAIFQSIITSIFSTHSANNQKELDAKQRAAQLSAQQAAQRAAEQQRINAAIAQAEYDKMMQSYKLLDGSQDLKIKTLNNTDLNFKTLDGDDERLSSEARKQFENTTVPAAGSSSSATGNATPFFGDTMPLVDIQTLADPENSPNVVDLRGATKYVAENIKNDSLEIVTILRGHEPEGNGEPVIQKPDCNKLAKQLNGFIDQRNQFQKTINLSQNELDIWETANRNALINATKDGLEYFAGQLFEGLSNRGKAADRLQLIYNKNLSQMKSEGLDVTELQAKIDRLRKISSTGQITKLANNLNDWQTFIKDGMSSLITRLTTSNNEIKGLLDDPLVQKYFTLEEPELNTLLDISKIAASNMVFEKWVAKKIPIVACIEISIKQTYNAFDWILSYNRIIASQKINGEVMNAAKIIQKNIDDRYMALSQCQ
jgi:hypothetical protein